jgi:hypothetical protein
MDFGSARPESDGRLSPARDNRKRFGNGFTSASSMVALPRHDEASALPFQGGDLRASTYDQILTIYSAKHRGGSAFDVKLIVRGGSKTTTSDQPSKYRAWLGIIKTLLRSRPFSCLNFPLPVWPGDYYTREAYINGLVSEDDLYEAFKEALIFYLTVNTAFFDVVLGGIDLSGPMQSIDIMTLDGFPFCKGNRRSGIELVA